QGGGTYSFLDFAGPIQVTGPGATGWTGSGTGLVQGPKASVASIVIDVVDGQDQIDIAGGPDSAKGIGSPGAPGTVFVGVGFLGSSILNGVTAPLRVEGKFTLDIRDADDTSPRQATLGVGSLTGLAPADIDFDPSALAGLQVTLGKGNDTLTVLGTAA